MSVANQRTKPWRPPSHPPWQDAGSYLVAAWCALQLPAALGAPGAAYRQPASRQVKKKSSERRIELGGLPLGGWDEPGVAAEDGGALSAHAVTHAERRHLLKQQQQLAPLAREPAAGSAAADPAGPQEQGGLVPPAGAAPVPALVGGAGPAAAPGRTSPSPATTAAGMDALWAAARGAMAEGARATAEGWRYVSSPANRDVAALVLMKCAAALVWGEWGGGGGGAGNSWRATPPAAPCPLHVRLVEGLGVCPAWQPSWPALAGRAAPIQLPCPAGAPLSRRRCGHPERAVQRDAGDAGAGRRQRHAGLHLCGGWVGELQGSSPGRVGSARHAGEGSACTLPQPR